jgi:hypothetical protein
MRAYAVSGLAPAPPAPSVPAVTVLPPVASAARANAQLTT